MSIDDLDQLLDRFDSRQNKAATGRDTEQTDEELFIAEFEKMRAASIKPTLAQLGDKIRGRGHNYAIREGQFTPPRGSRTQPDEAFIRMQIYLSNEDKPEPGDDERRCYLMFRTDTRKKVVQVIASDLTSTGGEVTKEGEFMVQQFTPMYVTEKFVHLFRRLSKKII
jgi:hypothetical protein